MLRRQGIVVWDPFPAAAAIGGLGEKAAIHMGGPNFRFLKDLDRGHLAAGFTLSAGGERRGEGARYQNLYQRLAAAKKAAST